VIEEAAQKSQDRSAGRTRSPRTRTCTDYDFPIVDKERTWKILDVIAPIAKAHGCSPACLSLAWLLAKPVVTSVIIGVKRLDQCVHGVDPKSIDSRLINYFRVLFGREPKL
jgi:aryl-alcohol dehydrogenase-like predicted oxidoreductase